MQVAKNEYSRNWATYEKIWKLFEEKRSGEDEWRESLPDTWLFATIKTAQAAFSDSKVLPIISRHEDEDQFKAKDRTDLYNDIAEKGDLDLELYYARLDAFKLGNGFLETVYVKDTRKVQEIKMFDPETNEFEYEEKEINDFDDPKTQRVSPYFMLVDEMARANWDTARDCIKIEVLGNDEAKRKYASLIGGDEVWDKQIKTHGELTHALQDTQTSHVAQTADTNTGNYKQLNAVRFFAPIEFAEDAIEILHYWDKIHDCYEIIANTEPIRVGTKKKPSPIPYISKQLPFTPIQYSPYSGDEFWAAGIIEIGLADSKAIKKHREMMSDRQKLSLFSPAFSDVNDEIDQKQLKLKPLSIIRTRGGVPKQFQIPGVTNGDFMLQDRHEASLKRAVGIDERVLGSGADSPRLTATEITFLREAALKRLKEFATLLYRRALVREVKLKFKLFEQYYSSPFKQDERVSNDGVKRIKVLAKEFKVKTGENIYIKKTINSSFFDGDIDVDIDMQTLLPMTDAQMLTVWAQVMRDVVPFAQAGLIDIDVEKVVTKYLEALRVNINSLRKDKNGDSVLMAEGEHRLFANENSSTKTLEILPEGTPPALLTPQHIKRHQELFETDDKIEEAQQRNLAAHIMKDVENLKKKMEQEAAQPQQINPLSLNQVGGMGGQIELPKSTVTGGLQL